MSLWAFVIHEHFGKFPLLPFVYNLQIWFVSVCRLWNHVRAYLHVYFPFHALRRLSQCTAFECSLCIRNVGYTVRLAAVYNRWCVRTFPTFAIPTTHASALATTMRSHTNFTELVMQYCRDFWNDNWMNLHRHRGNVDWNTKCPRQSRYMSILKWPYTQHD